MFSRRWSFSIGGMGSIRWSLMKTGEAEVFVMGARNQYLVLATVVKNAEGTFIINHVQNYPLGCTIPHTQIILLFSLPYINIVITTEKNMTNLANATSVEKRVRNTIIVVIIATSTFTSNVLLYHSPSKLKSMTTNSLAAFGSQWSSLAISVAKKAICPIFVSSAILLYIHVVLLARANWKFIVTSTLSTSPLLLKSINLTLQFVYFVFEKWIHSTFTIAQDAILLPTSIVLCSTGTGST